MIHPKVPSNPKDRLIVALDVSSVAEARKIVATLGQQISTYKVGKQLFISAGPDLIRELVDSGHKVFLDLKFHDIPNTVAAAIREAAKLKVSMLTVHAPGGEKMLRAAVAAAEESPRPPLVLAVTVLTSLQDDDLRQLGISGRVLDQVLRLAALARNAGCGGVVAAAPEASELRRELGDGFAIVTPGVRSAGTDHGDQARVVTPSEAIRSGATHIVVGRPITAASDPAEVAQAILKEISAGSSAVRQHVPQRG